MRGSGAAHPMRALGGLVARAACRTFSRPSRPSRPSRARAHGPAHGLLPVGALAVALAGIAGIAPGEAAAFVPKPDRALAGVAQANASSGRTQAIQLDLVLRIGDRDAIATGQLVSHPSGLARLELRGASGRVDRYLLSGTELLAAKDGAPLPDPQPMLQPVFLLQPSSLETLRVALASFGIDTRWIGVAPCGELDCYVFGDPELAAPVSRRPTIGDAAEAGDSQIGGLGEADDLAALSEEDAFASAFAATGPVARLWVDTVSLQIQRIDRASGETLQLGPLVRFERLMVPAWLEIQEPGRDPIHFDVQRAVRVNATPQAFNPAWLYAPVDPLAPGGRSEGVPAPAAPTTP